MQEVQQSCKIERFNGLLTIEKNKSLKLLTTFKIGGLARFYAEIADTNDLPEALDFAEKEHLPALILGGGSNMLVSDRGFPGLVLHIANRGIEVEEQDDDVLLRIASGEVWDDVVGFAVERGLWGIENLSRIPGQAGAVAVQNVGAYGREIKDVLSSVDVFDRRPRANDSRSIQSDSIESPFFQTLTNSECKFQYRKSIFNTTEKERYVICSTTLRLSKKPRRELSYPDVKKWFEARHETEPEASLSEIRHAIRSIRDKKFPFPAESVEGNAGSFFKNAVLTEQEYAETNKQIEHHAPEFLERLHTIRARSTGNAGGGTANGAEIKIPTAFLLELCGFKGFRKGNVQLNPTQPVIVLNETGNATAKEVMELVQEVRAIVKEKTGVWLFTEPELIGFGESDLRKYGFLDLEIERYLSK